MTPFKYTSVLLLVFVANFALHAEPAKVDLPKDELRADFNRMINDGQSNQKAIENGLDDKMKSTEISDAEKAKVIDFIDVEVGWGEGPSSIVDRRFDSVSSVPGVDLNALVPNFLTGFSKIP